MSNQLKDAIKAIHSDEYQRLQATEGQIKKAKRNQAIRKVTGWQMVKESKSSTRAGVLITFLLVALSASVLSIGVYYFNRFSLLLVDLQRHESLVDNEIQRRANLIPQLVAVSTEYGKHEKALYEHVAEVRNLVSGAKEEAKGEMALSLGKVMSSFQAVAEQYPDLKATQPYEKLMADWTETENRLASARENWIDTVRNYNGLCTTFPSNLYAIIFGEGKVESFSYMGEGETPADIKEFFPAGVPTPTAPVATTPNPTVTSITPTPTPSAPVAEANPTGATSEPEGSVNVSDQQ